MMCSLLLQRKRDRSPSRFARAFDRRFERLRRGYERTLDWALHHRHIMMFVLFATIGLNVYLYIAIPKGFFPQQDTGQLQGGIRGDASSSFQFMKRKLQEVARIIQQDPAVATVTGSVGAGGFGPSSGGPRANVTIALKPLGKRHISADRIIANCGRNSRESRAFRRFCKPCRTSATAADRPIRNINTRFWETTSPNCVRGLRSCAPRCRKCPN